ncbi:thioesterase II family protein [Bailinhaonella thermotolerans]|uniref:Thioesterase n=1 Tax=Bailinhaonella thermotolerans TaxID=1070861 RepID=A0A3A4AWP2_9ACTN|nr:alpha/beta fold hydrolase [Bailinhaonella thermotolerans]RJL31794.1 thioesterase [Bailinhaonella thermotolerans]
MSWFVPLEERPGARARLYVFPHAGGGPSSFAPLVPMFGPDVEVWSVNLPGRQARLRETPRTDLPGLVDDLAADLAGRDAGPPYALFGYCSGAMLAYLTCRRVVELGGRPGRLLAGSFAAPDVAMFMRRLPALPSELFWERLLELGGVPGELAARVGLRPVLEPALRADFALLAGYRHVAGPPLPVPITVLYGEADASLTRGGLLGWRRQSALPLTMRGLPASHWLAEEAPEHLARVLTEEVAGPARAAETAARGEAG